MIASVSLCFSFVIMNRRTYQAPAVVYAQIYATMINEETVGVVMLSQGDTATWVRGPAICSSTLLLNECIVQCTGRRCAAVDEECGRKLYWEVGR